MYGLYDVNFSNIFNLLSIPQKTSINFDGLVRVILLTWAIISKTPGLRYGETVTENLC